MPFKIELEDILTTLQTIYTTHKLQDPRNGYLSQIHHNRRGLSSKRLKVATIIHNFALFRNDGTTAASRLFGQQFPDLFEYLVENIGELPQHKGSFLSKLNDAEAEAAETQVWLKFAVKCQYLDIDSGRELYGKYNQILGLKNS